MIDFFGQLSVIIAVVLLVSVVCRILKQPLIIGYILTGIVVGPAFLNLMNENSLIFVFSEFGIAFLLFIVGLNLSPRVIREVGKISLVTGIGQVVFTSLIGYFIGIFLGFSPVVSLYIAVALTFSSTIIIIKLLADKRDLEKLYGKISVGFLLVQDFIAIVILIAVSSFSQGTDVLSIIEKTALNGVLLGILIVLLSIYVLPRFSKFFAKSQELLFLFAIAWGFGLASIFFYLGFSIEIGSLIAGIALSISPYAHETGSKLRPLRDFFIISFFLVLGSQIVLENTLMFVIPIVLFSLFILIGNPIIVMVLMGLMGYGKRTGFMAGLTVAQISEFSLILVALGVKVGHLSKEILSLVTFVGIITIITSTYLILYSDKIYSVLSRYLGIFEKKNLKERDRRMKRFDFFLMGYNRIGFSILKSFSRISRDYVVVDFDPEIVKRLSSKKINCIYGDVEDVELLDEIGLDNAKLVVSTIPDVNANLLLLSKIKDKNKNAIVILTARQISDAFRLYEAKADYVILPHFLGGEYVANIIENFRTDKSRFEKERNKHIKNLKERVKEGQEHPKFEKHK